MSYVEYRNHHGRRYMYLTESLMAGTLIFDVTLTDRTPEYPAAAAEPEEP